MIGPKPRAPWPWNFTWSLADCDDFRELARKGWDVAALARRFNVTEEEVIEHAKNNRIWFHRPPPGLI